MSKRMLTRRLSIGVLLFSLIPAIYAQGRMEYLGQAHVDGARDHDLIRVSGRGRVLRAIQIRVERGAINFDRVIVHYGNGQAEPIQIRSVIPAGGQTRIIDLPGNVRIVRAVEFYYARANWRNPEKPRVRLFGLR